MADDKEEPWPYMGNEEEEEGDSGDEPLWGDETPLKCLYSGYHPESKKETIDVLSSLPSPQKFFEEYVSKRKPCIIDCPPNDKGWSCEKWTNQYLIEKAGEEKVEVERRKEGGNFGLEAPKIEMKFGDFVQEIDKGSTALYITTQTIDCDDQGLPKKLYGPPLHSLKDDFPLVPELLGNLVPNNLNVWMGNSSDGSCSGLHHDFHDNLYVVVRGSKQFDLFSPGDGPHLAMHGNLSKIHPNGLINYKGAANMTREDGVPFIAISSILEEEAEKAVERAEEEVAKANEGGDQNEIDKASQILEDAEAQLEEVMEFQLANEVEDAQDDEDDDDDDQEEGSGGSSSSSSTNGGVQEPSQKRRKIDPEQSENGKEDDDDDDNDDDGDDDNTSSSTTQKAPDHFSKIDLTKDESEVVESFPDFMNTTRLRCQVKSGQMLYLPASWFHSVTSFTPKEEKEKGHIAFNYWVHPPDSFSSFENPYNNGFWKGIFEACKKP